MEQAIYEFPDHLVRAEELCRKFAVPAVRPERAVVLGMGGSAIGGDLAKAVVEKNAAVSVNVIRHEEIPPYVNEKTLVIAVSYSGNTHETLSAVDAVLRQTSRMIAIGTGGKLRDIAREKKIPFCEIPGGLMPRAALGYTFVPVLHILKQLFKLSPEIAGLDEPVAVLKKMREKLKTDSSQNEAAKIAQALHGKAPVIFAPDPSFAPGARRFKCQINENAKQPAFFDVFPEAVHNSIVGFTNPLPIHKSLAAVFLRDAAETPIAQKRIDFFENAAAKSGTPVHEVKSRGNHFLTRLLSFCYFADYVSYYLSKANAVDPVPIDVIDGLKKELAAVTVKLGTLT